MTPSFDRVADVYDATRGFPPGVAEQIAEAILRVLPAQPAARFLEPGIGTGRVALPLVRRGYAYTGADLSTGMLDELRRKLVGVPNRLALVRADAAALPFAGASFDVALAVHLLHLIPAWRVALAEIRRVLRPNGLFLYCSEVWEGQSGRQIFDRQWHDILARYGVRLVRYGAGGGEVVALLREQGAELATVTATSWLAEPTVGALLARYTGRVDSGSWQIPDAVFPTALRDFQGWVARTYPSDDQTLPSSVRFDIIMGRGWAIG